MTTRNLLLKNISFASRLFSLKEYKEHVVSTFNPHVSWRDLMAKLAKDKRKITTKAVSECLVAAVKKLNYSQLYNLLLKLLIKDVIYHGNRKVWNSYKLTRTRDKETNLLTLNEDLENACKMHELDYAAECFAKDESLWIAIIDKHDLPTGRDRVQRIKPLFFIHCIDEPYLFINGPNRGTSTRRLVNSVLIALQYDKARRCHLRGQDVSSLVTLLREEKEAEEPPKLVPVAPNQILNGTDFTQHENREEHVNKWSGTNPPIIENSPVKVKNGTSCTGRQPTRRHERGEAEEEQEEAKATKKRERVLQKPKKQTKRIRASAAGSSSPPRQLPPPVPATHIHQLPDDVFEKIFALLSLKTIVNVLCVCQRWQSVVEERTLNKELKFECGTFTTQEAVCLINSAPGLKSLKLSWRSDTLALLDAASKRCTNLLDLSVFCPFASSSGLTGALRKVFRTSPHITNLLLRYTSTSKYLRFYQELGGLLPDLRKLELHIHQLSDFQLDALVEGCSRNQMKEFKASFSTCFKETATKLVKFWGRSLRVLELCALNLTDSAFARLGGCSELRRLRLVELKTPGDWLHDLAPLSHLEELDLRHGREFNSENWCRFLSESRSSHILRKLYLGGFPGVDDRVLSSVAAFCPELEELDVTRTQVTLSGVREVLRCCRKLLNLHVYGADAGVVHILSELPQLAPQLRRIQFCYEAVMSVDAATLSSVRVQMPHLKIG